MMGALPKGNCRDEATSSSEKIKSTALTVTEVHLSEGISK